MYPGKLLITQVDQHLGICDSAVSPPLWQRSSHWLVEITGLARGLEHGASGRVVATRDCVALCCCLC